MTTSAFTTTTITNTNTTNPVTASTTTILIWLHILLGPLLLLIPLEILQLLLPLLQVRLLLLLLLLLPHEWFQQWSATHYSFMHFRQLFFCIFCSFCKITSLYLPSNIQNFSLILGIIQSFIESNSVWQFAFQQILKYSTFVMHSWHYFKIDSQQCKFSIRF